LLIRTDGVVKGVVNMGHRRGKAQTIHRIAQL